MSDALVTMPVMRLEQEAGWHALMDLHEDVPDAWTLVGGQMVHLWCAARGSNIARPTDDGDAVLDVRARPNVHLEVTEALSRRGFTPLTGSSGMQHRWVRDEAVIDLLIPRHLGKQAASRRGAGGGPTIQTPGAQKVLNRSETIDVCVGNRTGRIRRPELLGALVGKSAALTVELDAYRGRHVGDIVTLGTLLVPSDVRDHPLLDRRELKLLANGVGLARLDQAAWAHVPGGAEAIDRLASVVAAAQRRHEAIARERNTSARAARRPRPDAVSGVTDVPTRGKTSAKSNRASFAPRDRTAPEGTLS